MPHAHVGNIFFLHGSTKYGFHYNYNLDFGNQIRQHNQDFWNLIRHQRQRSNVREKTTWKKPFPKLDGRWDTFPHWNMERAPSDQQEEQLHCLGGSCKGTEPDFKGTGANYRPHGIPVQS